MIIRRRHTKNFTTISNDLFDDERLAADEVGILAYLLSRPHDWEVRRGALQRRWGIGREAMKRIVTNWIKTGWCWPVRSRAPNGTTFVIYDIRDVPGPELTDEDVRRALSLGSSEAAADDSEVIRTPDEVPETGQPPTGYPSLADPSPVDPYVANNIKQNTDLPRDESNQNSEREGARAREKHALNLVEFKRRWPTSASDDQSRIDEAWFALAFEDGEAALAGIAPFLAKLKADKRTTVPAGWKYLREKRWTLLSQPAAKSGPIYYPPDSVEARAIAVLHEIAGRREAFVKIWRHKDGSVNFPKPMTPQLAALGKAPPHEQWVTADRNGGGSWNRFLQQFFDANERYRVSEGSRVPWPFAPSATGKIYDGKTGPPDGPISDQDAADLK